MHYKRIELTLAGHSYDALQAEVLDPDPLDIFAAAMAGLDESITAEVQISVQAMSPWAQRRLRKKMTQAATKEEQRRGEGDRKGWLLPARRVQLALERVGLYDKLSPQHALWYTQVFIKVGAPTKQEARDIANNLKVGFAAMRGRNWFQVASLPFLPDFSDSDLPIRKQWFEYRWRTGLFHPRRFKHNVVTVPELAGLLKPPTKRCRTANVIRAPQKPLLVPEDIPRYTGVPGVLPLGEGLTSKGMEIVGALTSETTTALVVGRSRFGKSTIAQAWALHLAMVEGVGVTMIDPHNDAVGRVKAFFAGNESMWGRVLDINFAKPLSKPQPGFNLFDITNLNEERIASRPAVIADAISATMGWEIRSAPRVVNFITQAAYTLIHLSGLLPPEHQPTIFQLSTLLTNERWRNEILGYLPDALTEFWAERFPLFRDDSILPVTNLLDQFRNHVGMRTLLGQSVSTYDSQRTMDEGTAVLITTGAERSSKLLANLIVYDMLKTALSRSSATEHNLDHFLLADELQRYDTGGEGYFADAIREAGKFHLFTVGFVQDPNTLHNDTRRALFQNRSHLLVTASGAEVSGQVARQFVDGPEEDDILRMAKYHFVADIQGPGKKPTPFEITTVLPEDPRMWGRYHAPDRVRDLEAYVETTRQFKTSDEVERHLRDLDEKILDLLHFQARNRFKVQ